MKEVQANFGKYYCGYSLAAIVTILIELAEIPYIEIKCNGDGSTSQGHLEDVTSDGYKDWKDGALIGAKYALKKFPENSYGITIKKITGLTTDTNSASVAAATIYAIWKALDYVPKKEEIEYVEKVVGETDFEDLPKF